jgi:Flp pilus assembly protein TadG
VIVLKILAKLRKSERGQSLVEFALVLPILLFLVLGVLEFGWILKAEIAVNAAAREGARYAAVGNVDAKSLAEAAVPNVDVIITIDAVKKEVKAEAKSKEYSLIGFHVDASKPLGFYLSTKEKIAADATVTMKLE